MAETFRWRDEVKQTLDCALREKLLTVGGAFYSWTEDREPEETGGIHIQVELVSEQPRMTSDGSIHIVISTGLKKDGGFVCDWKAGKVTFRDYFTLCDTLCALKSHVGDMMSSFLIIDP
jgi:hypothetical protein